MYYIETKVYDKDYCIELFDTATTNDKINEVKEHIKNQLKKKYLNFDKLKIEQRFIWSITKRI